ncbi:extracellular solute-binding protein [Paenibacillus sp. FSL R5-0407]|uniref:ABC transporter substrate-binding protein n=1 Tax=Paenibacillus sp. FSL R5-0407 TaxID=2975320 RepID=UPI0030F974EA
MKKRLKIVLTIMVWSLLVVACSPNKESVKYEGDPEMTATLKVLTNTDERYFKEKYGDLFKVKYPNIEIQLVRYTPANIDKVIKEEKPDIFILSIEEYKEYLQKNRVYDLDALFSNEAFQLEGIHPEIVNYLRQMGNEKLYGLPTEFMSKAVFYNKDLFDKYGIPYPQDGMTWEEIFQLAERFPAEDGVYGFYKIFSDLVEDLAWSRGVNPINTKEMKVTLDTASYKEIFEMIWDAHDSKSATFPELDPFEVYDPFVTGKSAMTVDYNYYIKGHINWAKAEQGNKFNLNWDLASGPVLESSRETSPYFQIGGIYAINADSEQKQAAWEYIKFASSEELARVNSKSLSHLGLFTRTDAIPNPDGKRMEAFYNLKPDVSTHSFVDYDLLPPRTYTNLKGIIGSEAKAVMVGAKTRDEAIASMQERGQRLLDEK